MGPNHNLSIMMARSHGVVETNEDGKCMKFSFHFVINGSYRYSTPFDAKQLAHKLKEHLRGYSDGENIAKNIDMSVYNSAKGQKFKCIGSYKVETDRRILEPINELGEVIDFNSINVFDYLVSHSNENEN